MNPLKLYGLERSGTTYVQLLLEKNLEDVFVFQHILGSKHRAHVKDQAAWIAEELEHPNIAMSLEGQTLHGLVGVNMLAPFKTIAEYRQFLRELPPHLGSVRYVIVVKDPYSWFLSWRETRKLAHKSPSPRFAFRRHYKSHASWLALWKQHRGKVVVVRYEDVLSDFTGVLGNLAAKFHLQLVPKLEDVSNEIDLTYQTKDGKMFPYITLLDSPFARRGYYLNRAYLDGYPSKLFAQVSEGIDWALMKNFGYERASQRGQQ